jgi:uncharacterized protein (AIM24 family)
MRVNKRNIALVLAARTALQQQSVSTGLFAAAAEVLTSGSSFKTVCSATGTIAACPPAHLQKKAPRLYTGGQRLTKRVLMQMRDEECRMAFG